MLTMALLSSTIYFIRSKKEKNIIKAAKNQWSSNKSATQIAIINKIQFYEHNYVPTYIFTGAPAAFESSLVA